MQMTLSDFSCHFDITIIFVLIVKLRVDKGHQKMTFLIKFLRFSIAVTFFFVSERHHKEI